MLPRFVFLHLCSFSLLLQFFNHGAERVVIYISCCHFDKANASITSPEFFNLCLFMAHKNDEI